MRILITGGTGMIGKELGKLLHDEGHQIVILTRSIDKAKAMLNFPAALVSYHSSESIPEEALKDIDVIYNLAGENIGESRWTSLRKKELYQSRINITKKLVEALQKQFEDGQKSIKKFISVSAIGIYGNRDNEEINENSELGKDFLAQICIDWEKESQKLTKNNIQVINPRIGIVLSNEGGALDKLLPLFRTGLGSAVGSGKQWMSWIHHKDLVRILAHLLYSNIEGPINAVAPFPVTNMEFSKTLANKLKKLLLPKVPALVLKIALGEMSGLVLEGQKVSSHKIEGDGFEFLYPTLNQALTELTHSIISGEEQFIAEQWIPLSPEVVFEFFCDEKNLEVITPPFLKFKVLNKSTEKIKESTIINYQLSLHGLPMKWKTRIEEWKPPHRFTDVQLKGPYRFWSHSHEFIPMDGGTLLRDQVKYKLPLGILGKLIAYQKVKNDIHNIFKYRREYIARAFYN